MKRILLRGILVLLCLATVPVSLAACKTDKTEQTTTTENVTTEPVTETDENGYLKDDLPESEDFDRDFVIYSWSNQKALDWCDEEEAPEDAFSKALYTRQQNVEERFGVKLVREYNSGHWNDRKSFIQKLANRVLNFEQAYDLVDQYLPSAGLGVTENIYLKLSEVPNLNLEQPWWATEMMEPGAVGGNLYFITGEISPSLRLVTCCTYANLQLYQDLNLSDLVDGRTLYQVVQDYDWTMETMLLLGLEHADVSQGCYAFTGTNTAQADSFFYAGGFVMTKTDADGMLKLSPNLTIVHLNEWFDAVQEIYTNQYEAVSSHSGDTPFQEGKSIFHTATLNQYSTYISKGLNSTPLPMPMRDKSQGKYYTTTTFWVSVFSVPTDVKSMSESGTILEALASEAYRTVTDAVYEGKFDCSRKSTEDADMVGMMDLIADSVVFDGNRMYPDALNMFITFRDGVTGTTKDSEGNLIGWMYLYDKFEDEWKDNIGMLNSAIG